VVFGQQSYKVSTYAGFPWFDGNQLDYELTLRYNGIFYNSNATAVDWQGNVYVAEDYLIRKINTNGEISIFVGSGRDGHIDSNGIAASFSRISDMVIDSSGNLFVSESGFNCIRKITPNGDVTTFAGSGTRSGYGFLDGTGRAVLFNYPNGLAIDTYGNLLVCDTDNNRIRKITPSGVVTTIAGAGIAGFRDTTSLQALFNYPQDLDLDSNGNIYVAEFKRVRKISTSGIVTTLAGSDFRGYRDGMGDFASFDLPQKLFIDKRTQLIYVNESNFGLLKIRKVSLSGVVSTLALTNGAIMNSTFAFATFGNPRGWSNYRTGNILFIDGGLIRKIDPNGNVSRYAGRIRGIDGSANDAFFYAPNSIATDVSGNIYVADNLSNDSCLLRKITPSGIVSTLGRYGNIKSLKTDRQGNLYALINVRNFSSIHRIIPNGIVSASLITDTGLPLGGSRIADFTINNNGEIYILDGRLELVYMRSINGDITLLAGGRIGDVDGMGTNAGFSFLSSIALDQLGNLLISQINGKIRKISPSGFVSTVYTYNGSTGLSSPSSIAIDANGNVITLNEFGYNRSIYKIDTSGGISIAAGGIVGYYVDGPSRLARFYSPNSICANSQNELFVVDNNVIRKLTPCTMSFDTLSATICEGTSYRINNKDYRRTGVYDSSFINSTGCDSVFTLNLRVTPALRIYFTDTICEGTYYTLGGRSFGRSGVFNVDSTFDGGCISNIRVLTLTVIPAPRTNLSATICEGSFYQIGNRSFRQSGVYNVDSTFTNGCISNIRVLNLTVTAAPRSSVYPLICEGSSYQIGARSYNLSGSYYDTVQTNGCYSIINVILEVYQLPTIQTSETICSGATYVFGNRTYDRTGIYYDTSSVNGCRTITELNLTVRDTLMRPQILRRGDTLLSSTIGTNYIWLKNNRIVQQDTSRRLILRSNSLGSYYTVVASVGLCQSIVSEPFIIESTNAAMTLPELTLRPNPVKDQLFVSVPKVASVRIINALGQTVLSEMADETTVINTSSLSVGMYKVLVEGYRATTLIVKE